MTICAFCRFDVLSLSWFSQDYIYMANIHSFPGLALSSAEAPRGWERWIGEKEGSLGTTGRRKGEEPRLSSLFPLPSVPRALSLNFSPASKLPTRPSAKEATVEERGPRGLFL